MTSVSDLSDLGINVPANWNQMSAAEQDSWASSAIASLPQTGYGPAVNNAQRDSAFSSNWNATHGGETHWDSASQSWAAGTPAVTSAAPQSRPASSPGAFHQDTGIRSSAGITSTPITPTTYPKGGAFDARGANVDSGGGADAALTNSFKRVFSEGPPPPTTAVNCDLMFCWDGGGTAITVGDETPPLRIDFPARVTGWAAYGKRSETGSATFTVYAGLHADYPAPVSIVASAKPTISSSSKGEGDETTVTTWDFTLPRDTVLVGVLDTNSGFTKLSLALRVRRLDLTAST